MFKGKRALKGDDVPGNTMQYNGMSAVMLLYLSCQLHSNFVSLGLQFPAVRTAEHQLREESDAAGRGYRFTGFKNLNINKTGVKHDGG